MAAIMNWLQVYGQAYPIEIDLTHHPDPDLATRCVDENPDVATVVDGVRLHLHPTTLDEAIELGGRLRTYVWPEVPGNGHAIMSALCLIDMINFVFEDDAEGRYADDGQFTALFEDINRSGYRLSRRDFDALMIGLCSFEWDVLGDMLLTLCGTRATASNTSVISSDTAVTYDDE